MNQLAILYNINSPEKWQNCLREFLSAVKLGRISIDDIVAEIRGGDSLINSTLAEEYSSNLRKAVGNVFGRSDNRILYDANVTKFAYYKAAQATTKIRGAKSDDDGKAICQIYNRYQAAEYNAAVARCRTAKQWMSFDENRELFPNLRWIPSRSASPREEHRQFWNHVWAKDDEFWTINQPGNLWGCKCDWEETDDPITTRGEVNHFRPQQGLKGNPGITHEVFSEDHSY
ncbi:MAG: hypothetical protein HUJ96_08685, partial [Marinilabiliaceae bacterium]|nr:hypothetical protein [Marinilabiliaceae bacterium]